MPLIRCAKCGQAYDIPPSTAVRLPMSVATCHCGEWLCGTKAGVLARFSESGEVDEIDLKPFEVRVEAAAPQSVAAEDEDPFDTSGPRSIRVIARGADESINAIFTIDQHPLWIGRRGCHIELDDAELSIRHCSIERRRGDLVVHDSDSHTGTFLDGEPVTEAVISDGMHLLRAGSALLCIEPTTTPGIPIEPIALGSDDALETTPQIMKKLLEKRAMQGRVKRFVLICTEGLIQGQEFPIPPEGVTVGREGTVRVPDEYLSRKHFSIMLDEEGSLRVKDLGSRNGTFLNTLPARNTKVHPGDEIRAGVNCFRIEER